MLWGGLMLQVRLGWKMLRAPLTGVTADNLEDRFLWLAPV